MIAETITLNCLDMGHACLLDTEMTGAARKMRPIIKLIRGRSEKNPGRPGKGGGLGQWSHPSETFRAALAAETLSSVAVVVAAVAVAVAVAAAVAAAVAFVVGAAAPVGAVAVAGQDPASVPQVGFFQLRAHGILSPTQRPGHDGVAHKNSGHNADPVGVHANKDTAAENSPSIEAAADTTPTTSGHTTLQISQYSWEDKSNTGPIRRGRKSNTGYHSKTNHRCNRPTAY
jgi:hypothetical protein